MSSFYTSYKCLSLTTDYLQLVLGYRLIITGYSLLCTDYRSFITITYSPLRDVTITHHYRKKIEFPYSIAYCLLLIGYWLLVIDYLLLLQCSGYHLSPLFTGLSKRIASVRLLIGTGYFSNPFCAPSTSCPTITLHYLCCWLLGVRSIQWTLPVRIQTKTEIEPNEPLNK